MFSLLGKLLRGAPKRDALPPVIKLVRGSYDAAQTTDNNRRHWGGADNLSAKAANSPQVRRILRSRSRQETANNGYARGIGKTLANSVIGTGPRLQMMSEDSEANRKIEQQFATWAKEVKVARKLRTARKCMWQDGEAFLLLTSNPKHKKTPVTLDLRLVEADRCSSPDLLLEQDGRIDGIVYDEYYNPVEYHFLKDHPGDLFRGSFMDFDRVSAEFVMHLFDPDRAEQCRAVPESTTALPVLARLRDYCVSVMEAAKLAANHGGLLETNLPPDSGSPAAVLPGETVEPELNEYTHLPMGWKAVQMKAEQPTTTYGDFKGENLDEIGRSICMSSNVVRGNSAKYNYASGRLDLQQSDKSVSVEQQDLFTNDAVDVILDAYFAEACRIPGYMPFDAEEILGIPHAWIWPGNEHVDPNKESTADEVDLRNGTTTRKILAAKKGLDWETDIAPDLEKENELMARIQIAMPGAPTPQGAGATPSQDDSGDPANG